MNDKRSCQARAEILLQSATAPQQLRYAALELRMCIEAAVYEKLAAYSHLVPQEVINTWQPPQATKALLEFEPFADQSFLLKYGKEDERGERATEMRTLGEHKALSAKWLSKHYNKIGSLLHTPFDFRETIDFTKTKTYLNQVSEYLKDRFNCALVAVTLRESYSFDCSMCGSRVAGNKAAIIRSGRATCFNRQCGNTA